MDTALSRVTTKLTEWWTGFWEMLPNLAVAVLVVLAFWGISQLARRGIDRLLSRTRISATARPTIARVGSFVVIAIGLLVALHVLHLEDAAASLLAGAGVVGLALGLAFQDVAANYFAGFFLSVRHPFEVGDILETNDVFGVVEAIEMRTMHIRTLDGRSVTIPNRKVFSSVMTNHTAKGRRRVDLEVGVSYGDDLEKVERVAREAIESVDSRDGGSDVEVFFTGFGGSSIDLVARFWTSYKKHTDMLRARHEGVMAIKRAFDANDISIPFPIRTLDFGIGGGEKLNEMWPRSMTSRPDSEVVEAGGPANGAGGQPSAEVPS